MTKIFRSSFYRSKQPEPTEEEEPAAREYVDLEGSRGKHGNTPGTGGGGGSSDWFTLGRAIWYILLGCALLVCAYPMPKPAQDSHVAAIVGALYLAIGTSALAVYACTSWWRSSDSDCVLFLVYLLHGIIVFIGSAICVIFIYRCS